MVSTTVSQIISAGTASAGSSTDSTGIDLSSAVGLAIGYSLTFNASATEGATIELYADDEGASQSFTIGTNANALDSHDIAISAGNTVEGVVLMSHIPKYAKARVVNNDSTYDITGVNLYAQVQTA